MWLLCDHIEAPQHSCIALILILNCFVYLPTDRNNHPAFSLAGIFLFFCQWEVVCWLGLSVLVWGSFGNGISFTFLVKKYYRDDICPNYSWLQLEYKTFCFPLACVYTVETALSRKSSEFCLLLSYDIDLFTERVSEQNV